MLKFKRMNAVFYAIGDLFEALFPVFKFIGGSVNVFWMLCIAAGVFGWTAYVSKNPDGPEKLD